MTSNYNVFTNDSIAIGGKAHKDSTGRYTYVLSNHGNFMCISKSEITEKNNAPNVKNSCLTFSSTKYDECVNFIKWTETRFVRFLFFAGLLARNNIASLISSTFIIQPNTRRNRYHRISHQRTKIAYQSPLSCGKIYIYHVARGNFLQ